jgi:hypothetical protein
MSDDAKGMKSIAHMILQRGNNTNKTISPCFMELVERGGVAWLQKRELVSVIELEGQGVEDAVAIIDPQSGRMMAFIGPDFPPGHRLASISANDMAELAALFDHTDAWFGPRLRGVIIGTTHAILHGWNTARDARALLKKTPAEILLDRHGRRFLALLVTVGMQLAKTLDAFTVGRGRPADETRGFFLEELTRIAIDNGMELQLPQDRDEREGGITAYFTFILACIDLVLARVGDAKLDPAVRRRAAAFTWSRIALLHALERTKEKLTKSEV